MNISAPPCPSYPFLSIGEVRFERDAYTFGDEIQVVCPLGYLPDGPDVVVCQENGTWSHNVSCIGLYSIQPHWSPESLMVTKMHFKLFSLTDGVCPAPPNIENGAIDTSEGFGFSAKVFYSCNEGYTLEGPTKRRCRQIGNGANFKYEWNNKHPRCVRGFYYIWASTAHSLQSLYECIYLWLSALWL